jgi:molybdopterin converting factor small subunit
MLEPGATVQDLADRLFEAYPGLRDMRLRFAANARYASMDTVLHDGDLVACIPPVGGG